MITRARTAGMLLGSLAAFLLAAAGGAAANTYTYVACFNPDTGRGVGDLALPDGWAHTNAGGADYTSQTDCTGTATASKGVVIGNGNLNPQASRGVLRFSAPVDTTVTGYRWWRTARVYRNEASNGFAVRVLRNSDNFDDPPAGDSCSAYNAACVALGDPAAAPFADVNRVEVAALGAGTTSLSIVMFCDGGGGAGQCTNIGPGTAYYRLYGGKLTLEDMANPVAGAPGGTMFGDAASGQRTISVSATDQGGGLYSAELEIDGVSRGVQVFDANGGRCADVNPGNGDPYEFATPRPCKLSASSSFTVDTTQLAEGTHIARVVVRDAAGNAATSDTRGFTVDNIPAPAPASGSSPSIEGNPRSGEALRAVTGQWTGSNISYGYQWLRCDADGGACVEIGTATGQQHLVSERDVGHRLRVRVTGSNSEGSSTATSGATAVIAAPAITENRTPAPTNGTGTAPAGRDRGAPNGSGASDRVRLSAYVGRGRSTTMRARYGRSTTVSGTLLDAAGQPISGAVLQVQAGVRLPGSPFEDVGTVRTGRDGRYTYTLPAGPSRLVRFGYRSHAGDNQFADTTDVSVMVSAGVRLRPRPTRLRNGQSATFGGTVARPLPRRGVLVDLQVRVGRSWRTFAITRTRSNGRYAVRYRFRNTYRTTTFRFRARVRRDSRYPYLDGYSRISRMKVRG